MASGHLIHESGASIPCAVCNKSKDLFDHFSDPLHAEINKTTRTDKYELSLVFV